MCSEHQWIWRYIRENPHKTRDIYDIWLTKYSDRSIDSEYWEILDCDFEGLFSECFPVFHARDRVEIRDEYSSIISCSYIRKWEDSTHEIPEMHRRASWLHASDYFFRHMKIVWSSIEKRKRKTTYQRKVFTRSAINRRILPVPGTRSSGRAPLGQNASWNLRISSKSGSDCPRRYLRERVSPFSRERIRLDRIWAKHVRISVKLRAHSIYCSIISGYCWINMGNCFRVWRSSIWDREREVTQSSRCWNTCL